MFLSAACHLNVVYGLKVLERERLLVSGSLERPGGGRRAGVVRRPRKTALKPSFFGAVFIGAQTLLATLTKSANE